MPVSRTGTGMKTWEMVEVSWKIERRYLIHALRRGHFSTPHRPHKPPWCLRVRPEGHVSAGIYVSRTDPTFLFPPFCHSPVFLSFFDTPPALHSFLAAYCPFPLHYVGHLRQRRQESFLRLVAVRPTGRCAWDAMSHHHH